MARSRDSDVRTVQLDQLLRRILGPDPVLTVEQFVHRLAAFDASDGTNWSARTDRLLAALPTDLTVPDPLQTEYRWFRCLVADVALEHGIPEGTSHLARLARSWAPEPIEIGQVDGPRRLPVSDVSELDDHYDAVVIGAGAGGGIAARQLSLSGRKTLIIERGDYPELEDLYREQLRTPRAATGLFSASGPGPSAEMRVVDDEDVHAKDPRWSNNAMTTGGGSRVYGAQAWRLAPTDFAMASTYGIPDGSSLADWPLSYDDLESYYSRVEHLLGVSGGPFTDPWDGTRRTPLPMTALPSTRSAAVLERGAQAVGITTQPVPLLINSRDRHGRPGCIRCPQCIGFACPVGARAGAHNTTLVDALDSGNARLLIRAAVERITVDVHGRATGVDIITQGQHRDRRHHFRADEVFLAAGAIESARLLLISASPEFPTGLGNGHDQVGRHLQGHIYGGASALMPTEVVDFHGPGPSISTGQYRHGNPDIVGGGILANEFVPTPANTHRSLVETGLIGDLPLDSVPMAEAMVRFLRVMGPVQEVTSSDSRVRLDPRRSDSHGRPLAVLTGSLHPEDLKTQQFLANRAEEWLVASGAASVRRTGPAPLGTPSGGQHQAGTLRMGTDPSCSATTPDGVLWQHENIHVVDASTHVTNGGVNPVLTILANSLRITEAVTGRHD